MKFAVRISRYIQHKSLKIIIRKGLAFIKFKLHPWYKLRMALIRIESLEWKKLVAADEWVLYGCQVSKSLRKLISQTRELVKA